MWEYTTPSHGLPIGAFFRGESARNAYGKNDDYSIRKRNSTVVIVVVADWIKYQHILVDAFPRDTVLSFGDLEGPFGVRNGQNAQTMHHRRSGHSIVVG